MFVPRKKKHYKAIGRVVKKTRKSYKVFDTNEPNKYHEEIRKYNKGREW